MASLSAVEIGGESRFSLAMRVAQLALKRRVTDQGTPNRRIIAFIGSPLVESQDDLVKLGLRLKKNNIAVDVVNFGEENVNTQKLDAFINSVVSDDNSHLVTVPPGPHLLSDMLLTSPIVSAGGDMGGASGGGGDSEFPGVDASLDPELAMALRISLEEERRRQERARAQEGGSQPTQETTNENQPLLQQEGGDAMVDEDEELRRAIELSLKESGGGGSETKNDDAMQQDTDLYDDEQEMDEDEALRLALAMSQQQSGGNNENISDVLKDEEYMDDLLQNLGGGEKKDDDKKKEGK